MRVVPASVKGFAAGGAAKDRRINHCRPWDRHTPVWAHAPEPHTPVRVHASEPHTPVWVHASEPHAPVWVHDGRTTLRECEAPAESEIPCGSARLPPSLNVSPSAPPVRFSMFRKAVEPLRVPRPQRGHTVDRRLHASRIDRGQHPIVGIEPLGILSDERGVEQHFNQHRMEKSPAANQLPFIAFRFAVPIKDPGAAAQLVGKPVLKSAAIGEYTALLALQRRIANPTIDHGLQNEFMASPFLFTGLIQATQAATLWINVAKPAVSPRRRRIAAGYCRIQSGGIAHRGSRNRRDS